MKHELIDCASRLDHAALTAVPIRQLSEEHSFDLTDAYNIQEASIQKTNRGERLTGYKLGFTSKAKMEQMGVHSVIWGRLTDKMHLDNGGVLQRMRFIHPRVEPEIAFRISHKIDRILRLDEVLDYIDGIAPALEIIDSRYENFKFTLEDVVADNCSSSGYVIGDWVDPRTPVHNLSVSLMINDSEVHRGVSNAILGNPVQSIVEMSKMAVMYNQVIHPGDIILAGAVTPAEYIHSGDIINGNIDGMEGLTFKVS